MLFSDCRFRAAFSAGWWRYPGDVRGATRYPNKRVRSAQQPEHEGKGVRRSRLDGQSYRTGNFFRILNTVTFQTQLDPI